MSEMSVWYMWINIFYFETSELQYRTDIFGSLSSGVWRWKACRFHYSLSCSQIFYHLSKGSMAFNKLSTVTRKFHLYMHKTASYCYSTSEELNCYYLSVTVIHLRLYLIANWLYFVGSTALKWVKNFTFGSVFL